MLVPTDIRDPDTGEPLYVEVDRWPPPWWLILGRRLSLFARIVGRDYESGKLSWRTGLSVATAWAVACIVHGDLGKAIFRATRGQS